MTQNKDPIRMEPVTVNRRAPAAQLPGVNHPANELLDQLAAAARQLDEPRHAESTSPLPGDATNNAGRTRVRGKRTATNSPPKPDKPPRIERYELLEVIGAGGMGSVWKARQVKPVDRLVAIKLIQDASCGTELIRRFRAEQQTMARLNHAGIATILDAGQTADGMPFLAMELAAGIPLDEYCESHGLTIRQRLKLVGRLAAALQHAHNRGVIHRDLKPSNILVAGPAEHPDFKIIDFGISKLIDQGLPPGSLDETQTSLLATPAEQSTRAGQILGTPHFMSPEQADLTTLDIDHRSDIYSIGAVLYQLLTDTTPLTAAGFAKSPLVESLQAIQNLDPPRPGAYARKRLRQLAEARATTPRYLRLQLRPDLDWLVLRCLANNRNLRYDSMDSLAEDINRFLELQPIQAHPPSHGYRLIKWMQRSKTQLAFASALAIVAALALAMVSGKFAWDRQVRRTRWETATDRAGQLAQGAGELLEKDRSGPKNVTNSSSITDLAASRSRLKKSRSLASVRLASAQALIQSIPVDFSKNTEMVAGTIDRLQRQIEVELRSEQLCSDIDKAILLSMDYDEQQSGRGGFTRKRGMQLLAKSFADFGLWPAEDGSLAAAIGRFHRIPAAHQRTIVEGAHLWVAETMFIRSRQATAAHSNDQRWLIQFLNAVDSDAWRTSLRTAVAEADTGTIYRLSKASPNVFADQPPFALLLWSNAIGSNGQTQLAIEVLEKSLLAHRDNVWLNQYLGTVLLYSADPPDPQTAARFLTAAVALNPDHGGIRLTLGDALLASGSVAAAENEYRLSARLQPAMRRANMGLAKSLFRQHKLDQAEQLLGKWLGYHPRDGYAAELLGAITFQAGKLDESKQWLEMAIDCSPQDHSPIVNLSRQLCAAGDDQACLQLLLSTINPCRDLSQSLIMNTASGCNQNRGDAIIGGDAARFWQAGDQAVFELLIEAGNCLVRHDRCGDAIQYLAAATQIDSTSAQAQFDLAFAFHCNRQWRLAAEYYDRVLAIQPEHQQAQEYLRQIQGDQ